MPRSLAYCYEKIASNLNYIAEDYGERHKAHETAESIRDSLRKTTINRVMDEGLHEFLERFINRNGQLGQEIMEGYRFYQ